MWLLWIWNITPSYTISQWFWTSRERAHCVHSVLQAITSIANASEFRSWTGRSLFIWSCNWENFSLEWYIPQLKIFLICYWNYHVLYIRPHFLLGSSSGHPLNVHAAYFFNPSSPHMQVLQLLLKGSLGVQPATVLWNIKHNKIIKYSIFVH